METTNRAAIGHGQRRIDPRRLPLAAILAALGAAVVNAVIYVAASSAGFIRDSVPVPGPGGEQPLTAATVVIVSVVGVVGAAIVFAAISRMARRPVRTFRIVATAVLVLSLATPLTIAGAPAAMVATLMLMHVVAWGVSLALLTRTTAREVSA